MSLTKKLIIGFTLATIALGLTVSFTAYRILRSSGLLLKPGEVQVQGKLTPELAALIEQAADVDVPDTSIDYQSHTKFPATATPRRPVPTPAQTATATSTPLPVRVATPTPQPYTSSVTIDGVPPGPGPHVFAVLDTPERAPGPDASIPYPERAVTDLLSAVQRKDKAATRALLSEHAWEMIRADRGFGLGYFLYTEGVVDVQGHTNIVAGVYRVPFSVRVPEHTTNVAPYVEGDMVVRISNEGTWYIDEFRLLPPYDKESQHYAPTETSTQ